jgi:hypothetical protein
MFMPYYKEQMDLSVDDVMENLDLLFKNADYVGGYKLLGGEPLINRELPDMLTAIYEKYGDRIGTLGIITNGTITPDDRLLEAAKRCGVTIDISDYTGAVDYDGHLDKTIAAVRDAGIKYRVNRSLRWCDFGFPAANRQYGFDEVNGHMLSCGPIFHGLNDGRFYYCHVSWSADKAGLLHNAVDDYIDLKELDGSDEAKERLLSHSRGEIEKGFVKLCKLCGGCGADNTEIIEVAEQCE